MDTASLPLRSVGQNKSQDLPRVKERGDRLPPWWEEGHACTRNPSLGAAQRRVFLSVFFGASALGLMMGKIFLK